MTRAMLVIVLGLLLGLLLDWLWRYRAYRRLHAELLPEMCKPAERDAELEMSPEESESLGRSLAESIAGVESGLHRTIPHEVVMAGLRAQARLFERALERARTCDGLHLRARFRPRMAAVVDTLWRAARWTSRRSAWHGWTRLADAIERFVDRLSHSLVGCRCAPAMGAEGQRGEQAPLCRCPAHGLSATCLVAASLEVAIDARPAALERPVRLEAWLEEIGFAEEGIDARAALIEVLKEEAYAGRVLVSSDDTGERLWQLASPLRAASSELVAPLSRAYYAALDALLFVIARASQRLREASDVRAWVEEMHAEGYPLDGLWEAEQVLDAFAEGGAVRAMPQDEAGAQRWALWETVGAGQHRVRGAREGAAELPRGEAT